MATATGRGDRVAFLKDLLGGKPEVNHKEAGRAWQEAGHEGTISGTSFYRVKSDLGIPGKGNRGAGTRPGRPPPRRAKKKHHRRASEVGNLRLAAKQADAADNGQADRRGAEEEGGGDRDRPGERVLDEAEAHIDDILFP